LQIEQRRVTLATMNVHSSRVQSCGLLVFLVAVVPAAFPRPALALRIDLERPGDKEFVRDLAGMINPADKAKIVQVCTDLLKAKATPIIVVTIDSMATHGGADLRIETFARLLFDQSSRAASAARLRPPRPHAATSCCDPPPCTAIGERRVGGRRPASARPRLGDDQDSSHRGPRRDVFLLDLCSAHGRTHPKLGF
jgi:hypothetical protein